jgi:Neprosin
MPERGRWLPWHAPRMQVEGGIRSTPWFLIEKDKIMRFSQTNPQPRAQGGRFRLPSSEDLTELNKREIVDYYHRRQRELKVVATTKTSSGQVLDWIPRESQTPSGAIASPPPIEPVRKPDASRHVGCAQVELEVEAGARGPEGMVPVLRKGTDHILFAGSLGNYLAGKSAPRYGRTSGRGGALPAPNTSGFWYAESGLTNAMRGAECFISVNNPWVQGSHDHALIEMNCFEIDENNHYQSAEVGVLTSNQRYGDWSPHLFTFYTTNDYTTTGDYQQGYDRDVKGWIQYDSLYFPGCGFTVVSTPNGPQYDIFVKYQLYQSNWWLRVNDRWLGYYPCSLYEGNRSVFDSLGDHASNVDFYGEVAQVDEKPPSLPRTQMGSGYWADQAWPWAAFQHSMRIQDRFDNMQDFVADSTVANQPGLYGLETHFQSGTDWGSYQWLGGPGAP